MEGDVNMWNLVKKHCPDSGRIFCLGVGGHVRHCRHPDQARSFVLIGNKYKGLFCEVFFYNFLCVFYVTIFSSPFSLNYHYKFEI